MRAFMFTWLKWAKRPLLGPSEEGCLLGVSCKHLVCICNLTTAPKHARNEGPNTKLTHVCAFAPPCAYLGVKFPGPFLAGNLLH